MHARNALDSLDMHLQMAIKLRVFATLSLSSTVVSRFIDSLVKRNTNICSFHAVLIIVDAVVLHYMHMYMLMYMHGIIIVLCWV